MDGRYLLLPYDGSPVAKVMLARVVQAARQRTGLYDGVLVATVGVDRDVLDAALADARVRAGREVPVAAHFLDPCDPLGSLHTLVAALPDATLTAPLGAARRIPWYAVGPAPWYTEACRMEGLPYKLMLFFLNPRDVAKVARPRPTRGRLARGVIAVLRLAAHRRPDRCLPVAHREMPVGGGNEV